MEEKISLNPFTRPEIVAGYETWYQTVGWHADQQEKGLLKWLLAHFQHAKTILEVGCGTGHFTRWFGVLGMQATWLDLSHLMLEEAKSRGSAVYLQGDALRLPFLSKSIDLVAMISISAQVSLYPFGKEDLSPAIDEALHVFGQHGLEVVPGSMSTLISGGDEAIFSALQAILRRASEQGRVVMVVTFSNACPMPGVETEDQGDP